MARYLSLVYGFSLLVLLASAAAVAAEHPRLVSLEATTCSQCHAELTEGKTTLHAPAEDDCTTCHEMAIGEGKTTVTLIERDPALCLICHDELTKAAEGELETPHFPVTDGCLTCHDPHGSDQPRLLRDAIPALCTDCHTPEELQPSHGGQLTASTACQRCHLPHGGERPAMLRGKTLHPPFADASCSSCHQPPFAGRIRLARRGDALCTACHGDVDKRPSPEGSVHPALAAVRGRAGCLSCHDPHLAEQPRLLVARGNELCRRCHGDVVAAAEADTGHFPAADDCLTCHLPHTASAPHLLNAPASSLCTDCHDPGDSELVAAHLGADLSALSCTGCHTPHGDGNAKLLARVVHPPIEDGCDTCHLNNRFDRQLEDGDSALCLLCHDDIAEVVAAAAVPHEALDVARCTDCHNPHAAAQDHLIPMPAGGECLACHDEMAPNGDEKAHSIIALVGCRACHEPHGGSRSKLLRAEGDALCLSCHDPRSLVIEPAASTVLLLGRYPVPVARARAAASLRLSADGQRDHPVDGHRVIGAPSHSERSRVQTTFEGALSCLSCHDPHKGRTKLLRWNASSTFEACIACHPK